MSNPQNPFPFSGSYDDLLKRMTRLMRENQVDNQILLLLQQTYEKELGKENVILSRPERTRLYQQVAKTLLMDVLDRIENPNRK
jgi:hypothetical protein